MQKLSTDGIDIHHRGHQYQKIGPKKQNVELACQAGINIPPTNDVNVLSA
jgi:hypothetical protein